MALLSLLVVALFPAAALADPADGMGCPQGYVVFDAQRGEGGPPSYLPGGTVVANGYLTDAKAKAAPSVTLRWGAPEGAAVGTAAIDAEGSWRDLRFTIPENMANGIYTLYLEARDAEGRMLPGLPIPARLRVGPPAPAALKPTSPSRDRPAKRQIARRVVERRAQRAGAVPSPAPVEARPVERPRPVVAAPARARREVHNESSTITRRAERHSLRGGGTPLPAVASGRSGEGAPVPALVAALLVLLALASVLLWRRRRPLAVRAAPRGPLDDLETSESCPIDAELQEMIAEQRAKQAPDRTDVPA